MVNNNSVNRVKSMASHLTTTTATRRKTIVKMNFNNGMDSRRRLGVLAVFFVLLLFYSMGSVFIISFSGQISDDPPQHDNTPFIPSKSTGHGQSAKSISEHDGFSACLLVMDDNHFLSEWIAYHYFTTDVRTLIIAMDPNSLTSPFDILAVWKDRINIIHWTQDSDYMSSEEFETTKQDVAQYFTKTTPQLIEHRARQRLFYTKCLRKLKAMDASWTLLLDTDEFVRINYQLAEQYNMTAPHTQGGNSPRSVMVMPISQQGSVSTLIRQSTESSTAVLTPSVTEQTPLFVLQSSPCVQVPRIRFVSTVDSNGHYNASSAFPLLSQTSIDANNFLTLRYSQCAQDGDLKRNKISKAILDLSRISENDIVPVDSIHLPVRAHCQQRRLHTRKAQSLLAINHYMGSYEQYVYRENDARHGLESRKNNQIRNAEQFQKAHQLKQPDSDREIMPWITGFMEDKILSMEEKQNVLRQVGKLDSKSWRTYEGDPMTERCALLFFGLPRAFKTMVLPSIKKNLLIPNARHHCDIYVHFYQQQYEAPGRRNRGGSVDPEDIFLLTDAVERVFQEFGPRQGSRTRNGRMRPIVAFTHDTPGTFSERRKVELEKFHNATSPDGRPLYFPWAAKTYTATALDNMIRQWHSIEYAFKLMEFTARQKGISYNRVAMFRSDALYMTPIDIAEVGSGLFDTSNNHFVTAPFARYPVNDRSIYGPYEAVKIWATQRWQLLEDRARAKADPGFTMHSERFLNGSVIPAMEDAGYKHSIHPDICFVRTRADESAIVSDCIIGGATRNWDRVDPLNLVETLVERNCTSFQMGQKWKFVGCGEDQDYKNGKGQGWL
jgi:hypothetical protein